jgi:hypothetical protein
MRRLRFSLFAAVLLALLASLAPVQASQGLSLDPGAACGALREWRLDAGTYRPVDGDRYACTSRRQRLPLGEPLQNEVRYSAHGNRERVDRLELHLDLFGRREVQPSLRRLLEYTEVLFRSLLGSPVDGEIADALLAGGYGEWDLASARVRLLRNTATGNRGFRYSLIVE